MSQLSDDSCAQPPYFVVGCKHKKIDEESHERIKRQRKGQRGIPRHYQCVRCEQKYEIDCEFQQRIFGILKIAQFDSSLKYISTMGKIINKCNKIP